MGARLGADHELVVAGLPGSPLETVSRELGATPCRLDLAEPGTLGAAVRGVGDVDALVHCAGVEGTAPAAELDPPRLARVLAVNLAGPVELTRLLLPGLRRRRGRVVFLNSTAVGGTFPGWAAYAASKAGLRAYADTLRLEEREHGVRVSSIFPGRTDTDLQREIAAHRGATFDPATAMSPDTVALAVLHVLCSPADAVVEDLTLTPFDQGR